MQTFSAAHEGRVYFNAQLLYSLRLRAQCHCFAAARKPGISDTLHTVARYSLCTKCRHRKNVHGRDQTVIMKGLDEV